ncbi:MAG TPA: glycosyltransferase, partial [Pyrinomonadaceae bacterium]|nr:glycosyltransferase [Pyrinomonadaceae bacterium]
DIATFTGFFDDVFAAVNAFDLFVLPSDLEGVPYVVLEAMSQAKPIVATRVGGVPEAVIHEETGLLIPPRDPKALAAAIETLITDEVLAARLARNAYTRFKEHFTIERMVERHEMLYEELANKPQTAVGREQ